ncbi:MAG: autotransporter outer membrane beta-barrel domain-containing protein, partial [Gammaproteobacteria bacterium]|nr:autotransporter outer membrane beta-barrel domain-containing protein [Gammaproteobacteria bacterium]
SPTSVGAQSALNDELTKEQLSNISRRLTALRRGQSLTILSGLTLNYDNSIITGNMFDQLLQENASGGSAGSGFASNQQWFISGKIGGGKQDETIYESGFTFDNYALTVGSDYRFDRKGLMGWALGYGQTNMNRSYKEGGMDVGNYNGTLYGSYYPSDNSYIDVIGVITLSQYDMQRRVVFGSTDVTAKSDTNSTGYALSLGGGYDFARGGFSSTLNTRLDYLRTTIDGYQETNAGSYNIAINKQQVSQLVSSLGTQLRYAFSYSWGVLVPHFNVSWLHQFQGNANKVKGSFLVDPNSQFSFKTNSPSVNYYVLSLGTSATFADGVSSYIQYETTVAQKNLTTWTASAGLRFEW